MNYSNRCKRALLSFIFDLMIGLCIIKLKKKIKGKNQAVGVAVNILTGCCCSDLSHCCINVVVGLNFFQIRQIYLMQLGISKFRAVRIEGMLLSGGESLKWVIPDLCLVLGIATKKDGFYSISISFELLIFIVLSSFLLKALFIKFS